jgi:pilus assembly protein Flp/PilA
MKTLLVKLMRADDGQDIIEYALLAGFISLAAATILPNIGQSLIGLYGNVDTQVGNAAAS